LDAQDFAIFRYMFPNGEGRFWGSRSIIDPRITPREIGERVGLSEVAVRGRIAKLRAEGFILGADVWPNPRLFGATQHVLELTARDTSDADRILRSLRRIDGVLSARVMIDEDARHVRVSYVNDNPKGTERRTQSILRLTDHPPFAPPLPEWIPPCNRKMKPLDWRIVMELRNAPEAGLGVHAQRLGLTLKTVSQRFHALLDSNAVFWTVHVDNCLLPVAACFVDLKDPSSRDSVSRAIESRIGRWLPTAPGGLGEPPQPPAPWIAGMFWVPAPAATENLTRELMRIPGVRSVRRRFPSTAVNIPTWFDDQLEVQLSLGGTIESARDLAPIPGS
jgi:DNA-binding Lrp family transcriptional regulator